MSWQPRLNASFRLLATRELAAAGGVAMVESPSSVRVTDVEATHVATPFMQVIQLPVLQ